MEPTPQIKTPVSSIPEIIPNTPSSSLISSLLSLESTDLLKQTIYSHPKRFIDRVGSNGSVAGNRNAGGVLYIELQRYGAESIQAGYILNNTTLIEQGIQVLNW